MFEGCQDFSKDLMNAVASYTVASRGTQLNLMRRAGQGKAAMGTNCVQDVEEGKTNQG